jgi:hypothetical protein
MSDTDAPAPQTRRLLLIGLGVLVVAALAYLLLVVPNQGVEDVDQTQAVVGSEPAVVGSEPEVAPSAPAEDSTELPSDAPQEPSFEVFSARDPFDQLVVEDSGTGGSDGTQDTTTPSDGTDTATDPDPAQDGGSPDTSTGEPAQAEVGVTTIRLDEVFSEGGEQKVIVEVNSDGYEAAESETVAGGLKVLDIADSCATMSFDGNRFILCEGERIEK